MRLFLLSSSSSKEQNTNEGSNHVHLYLNVYDLTPINNYLYWFGLGIFPSGIEGSFCNCLLPDSIQVTAVRHLPDPAYSEDGSDSGGSSVSAESEEESDHQFLTAANTDVAFLKDKPVRLAKALL